MRSEPAGLIIRRLETTEELAQCSVIEHQIWCEGVVPPSMLRAVTHMGGLAVGAWDADRLAGFVFGFVGLRESGGTRQLLHHSHVLAVLPAYRRLGLGTALKQEQARLCREQGIMLMTWTFDPLRARNAHLNLEVLGALSNVYEVRHYGDMHDEQNGRLDSDRLLAMWRLDGTGERTILEVDALPVALASRPDGTPGQPWLGLSDPAVRVAVPADLDELLASSPRVAMQWRESVRTTLLHYFSRGYSATRFLQGNYVLESP